MQSLQLQSKPAFSWKALGWALLYFWFFSSLLQAVIYFSGYSGSTGLRDSLLFSSLWLIPVFLFPNRIRIIAAVIGIVLWAASLAALSYYVIYGQEFSQSVLYVMFETNANEASEYLSQYFSLKIVLIALAYTAIAILLWTRLRPVHIPSPWRYLVSFALLYGLILHPMTVNTFIKQKPFEKTLDGLASRMEPAAPWQFISGYYQYRQQLTSLNSLLNENNALPPLANFKDSSGDAPRTLVLVIGESTQRGRMSLYGYPRETTPELDALHKSDPNFTVFNNVVTSRPYTIEILQQALTFANEKNPDLYLTQPSLMNMMKQAGYKTFWITNQQTMTARNTMLTVFSKQTDKQFYMNQQRTQSAREYDSNVLAPFKEVLADPAPKKFIIVHLLGTHIKYKFRYPDGQGKFDNNIDNVPAGLSNDELEAYNDYDSANVYNDHIIASLIKDYKATDPNGFLLYFSDHGEEVYDTPPHKTQGRNEDSPTRHMYTVPFLLWTSEKWQAAHPRDFSQDVNRKYSSSELIHTWSDLAGFTYDGFDPTRAITNPQFKETTRWIGNPYKKNALIDYDSLPYGDQIGNQ
ncbi:phosphoethanolamine transferase CptA [Citrobacter freundii]|uniref:Phosphoethanolamine transferase CptA n=1 Tax=Citrobacter meridianamericanus TaxID=2894201 RepID=A0ABT1BDQ7_9ENTR|nr:MULTISPECIES: phosphoethanolamine transferase CptA [Citrobacter]MBC6504211.1 phosphoethanolamine transferase CptA [Citrobacter freundii]MBC6558683.1 phosphoethanolamine transferase CptA [Citrobacter braakii]MBC6509023.1 phosphoethanolamine transferase CptA [Citrobacter freundii]MBP8544413.1 phosphoethanolamine transferase CptA [Citrobacter sp. On2M]MBW5275963.1 phosphoethanolamine transferase CptA [Citrobacter sp. On28M]